MQFMQNEFVSGMLEHTFLVQWSSDTHLFHLVIIDSLTDSLFNDSFLGSQEP